MAAEVLLQVEDRQRVALIQRQQLAQGRISLDRLLVHQAVLTRIRHHALRHRRAAHLRVLRLTEERAQLGADRHRLREDARLGLSALNGLRLALAAALSLLHDARGLLLNHLQRRRRRAERRLQRRELIVQVRDGLLERGTNVLFRRLNGRRRQNGSNSRHRRRGNDGRRLDGLRLGLLGRLHLLLGNRLGGLGGNGGRGSNNGSNSSGGSLLGRLHGGTHDVSVGGSIGGHGTRNTYRGSMTRTCQVCWPNPKSCHRGLGRRPTFVLK